MASWLICWVAVVLLVLLVLLAGALLLPRATA
jgi:hypothetical protein